MKQKTLNPGKNKASTHFIIFLTLLMLGLSSISINGQSVKISDNGSTLINPGAVLDIESNTKGIMIPSMPFNDIINNIPPFDGLIVYNTTDHHLMFFNGFSGLWEPVGAAPISIDKIIDYDLDTYITVEQGTDDDTIRYYVAGMEQWRMTGKALEPINSGSSIFIGEGAGKSDAQDNQNVFIGRHVGYNTTIGGFNTIMGHNAFENNITGADNTGVGDYSLSKNSSGRGNTAIGNEAMKENTTGFSNVGIGTDALLKNTIVSNLVAIGDSALFNNGASSVGFQGYWNTAVGSKSLLMNSTGYGNSAFGYQSMYTNSSGTFNTAMGSSALYSNTTGSSNTAVGISALYSNTSGNNNTALGQGALNSNQTGNRNIGIGTNALFNNTAGSGNIAFGSAALHSSTTLNNNIAIGDSSLYHNGTGATGEQALYNTAVGSKSMKNNSTGSKNTAMGYKSLNSNTIGFSNTSIGYLAGEKNLTGNYNTFIGSQSGKSNTDGVSNVFVGAWSGRNNTSGKNNVFVGDDAGQSIMKGSNNVFVGENAGYSNDSIKNVFIGRNAGYQNSGEGNVFIGYEAGKNHTASSNKLIISNSNTNQPIIDGDFQNQKIIINGDLSVKGSITGNHSGYFSMGPASFKLSNELLFSEYDLTTSCYDDDFIASESPQVSYIKDDVTLKVNDFAGPIGKTQKKMSFQAPINIPHNSTIDSLSVYVKYVGASPNVYVCFALIQTELATATKSEIRSFRVDNNSISNGTLVGTIPNSFNPASINHKVNNSKYTYSLRIRILGFDAGSYQIVGAVVKYD